MARPAHLEKRLIAILNPATKREALSRRPAVAVVLCLVCLVAPLAAMRGPDLESNGPREAVAGSAASAHVIKYTTPPLYSDEALGLKIEGVVTVEATVGREGRATNLRVLNGLGFGLDENALLAVRDWQFAPALHNGKAVVSTTQVDVEFSLLNAELNDMIANDMATRVGPDVEPPRIVHRVEPRYPWLFSEARQGSVLLDVVIQEDGIPRVVRVLRSLTWQFDEAAIAALEQWRFSPASLGGSRVKVRMNVEIPFVPLQN